MHDPQTVAFDIRLPRFWTRKYWDRSIPSERRDYGIQLAIVWHCDPETDGTDDSCGWFMRARHGDPKVLTEIEKDFAFEWDHGCPTGWFYEISGDPAFSPISIVLGMFFRATNQVFGHWSKRRDRFMRKHLFEILYFAENNSDSICTTINQSYLSQKDVDQFGAERVKKDRIADCARSIYSWILRADRPWYRHPRWHVWHWKIQIPVVLKLKRWLWSRCCKCGNGFRWGESVVATGWHSTGPRWFRGETDVMHNRCSGHEVMAAEKE